MQLAMGVQAERYQQDKEITDAWSADNSTAGERALRVGSGGWVQVSAAGRRSLNAGPTTVRLLYHWSLTLHLCHMLHHAVRSD